MYNMLTQKIPEFLVWNELDEHRYLIWPLTILIFSFYELLTGLNLGGPIVIIGSFIPVAYYVFIIIAIIRNDGYPFDISKLNLNASDEKFVTSSTQIYKDRITFFIARMTNEKTSAMSKDEKIDTIQRFYNALLLEDKNGCGVFDGEIHLSTGFMYEIDSSDVDVEFVNIFIEIVNPLIKSDEVKDMLELNLYV